MKTLSSRAVAAIAEQAQQVATLLGGDREGYLPTTVRISPRPDTGKMLTTRWVYQSFAECEA